MQILIEDNNYLVDSIKKIYPISTIIECYGMYGVKCKGVVIKEFYKHSCLRYGMEVFIENHGVRFIELDEIIKINYEVK